MIYNRTELHKVLEMKNCGAQPIVMSIEKFKEQILIFKY